MFKKVFPFLPPVLALIVLSACAERGYQLTVNQATKTVTAIKSVDIRQSTKSHTKTDIDKMNTAVNRIQTKQTEKPTTKPTNPTKQNTNSEPKKVADVEVSKKAEAEKAKVLQSDEEARVFLADKLAKEKEENRVAAEKKRTQLAKKAEADEKEEDEKAKKIKALQDKKEKQALSLKLKEEKEAKIALEQKLEKQRRVQIEKERKEKATLKHKQEMTAKKKAQEEKKAQALKVKAEREAQATKVKAASQTPKQTTATLHFKQSTQTYQKFGTSEIHGHVVYLANSGNEVTMQKTKIYLVPKNTKTDYWYKNFYLKNTEAPAFTDMTVQYINATHLNLEKNFAFYGLAKGTYYVIIESSYPAQAKNSKKVYIAKEINVDKYKKIMTVFSKKL